MLGMSFEVSLHLYLRRGLFFRAFTTPRTGPTKCHPFFCGFFFH
jgi:hypothetical protein